MSLKSLSVALLAFILLIPLSTVLADQHSQTPPPSTQLPQSQLSLHAEPQSYPKIVLFSVSWCPHCKEAKEYFTQHNIPFINRDVEIDEEALKLVTEKYKSEAVPIIVIGNDEEVIRGFNAANFEKVLEKYRKK